MPIVPAIATPPAVAAPNRGWLVAHDHPTAADAPRPEPAALTASQRARTVEYIGRIGEVGSPATDRLETIGETSWFAGSDLPAALESARLSATATARSGSEASAVAVRQSESGSLYLEPVRSRPDAGEAPASPPTRLHIGGSTDGHATQVQLFDNDVVALVDAMGSVQRS